MATTDFFTSCVPAIRTNIATCGALTLCDLEIPTPALLDTQYKVRSNFLVMEALFQYQMESAMCMAQQSNLFKFFMANSVNMSKRLTPEQVQTGLYQIKPYILNKRKGTFDNNYWIVQAGTSAGAGDWCCELSSPTDIPVSASWFNVGERLFIEGAAADGTATRTAWRILSSVADTGHVDVCLTSENALSNYDAARLAFPVTGVAVRGTANISDFEEFCAQPPGLINTTVEPYWIETIRDSFCVDDLYEQYRALVVANNPLYREFYDLPTVEYNKQAAEDFQRRWVNTIMYNKALNANQTLALVDDLPQVDAVLYDWTAATVGQTEGFLRTSAARCVGKKANAIGILEQLAGCDRIHDAQGTKLNLKALFQSLYRIYRIRKSMGYPNPRVFELCMPSPYIEVVADALFQYCLAKSHGLAQLNMEISKSVEQSPLGFRYRRFVIDYPDIEIRLVSDEFFDDELAMFENAATTTGNANLANVGRRIYILDWSKIYLGIIGSEKVEHQTADAKERARTDPSYLCVMKVPTTRQSLMSTTYTVIVERPQVNLVIENLSNDVPEWQTLQGDYDDN